MAKLIQLLKSETASIGNATALIFKKDLFPSNVDAGQIDTFIDSKFPNLISRDSTKVNGVSVTRDEIIITTNFIVPQITINKITSELENNVWP